MYQIFKLAFTLLLIAVLCACSQIHSIPSPYVTKLDDNFQSSRFSSHNFPKSSDKIKFPNTNRYLLDMTKRGYTVRLEKYPSAYQPLVRFRSDWKWATFLNYSQRRDQHELKTAFVKVGSILYLSNIVPQSFLSSGNKIETFSDDLISKQRLKYRPVSN